MLKSAVCLVLIVTLCGAAEVPIRQVVLYKHGVGYFERSGTIPAGDTAQFDFRAAEMNDVLKSLTVNGRSANVTGLRYDSSVPLEVKLADFPFRIDGGSPLSGVLDQLKGARVDMQVGSEKVSGAIVAARMVAGDKERPERQQIVLLMDSGEMRTFDLDAATSMRFADAKLQGQFRDYLGALQSARSKEKRSVYLDGNASGGRDITAEYIIPMPIWKSSYRLLFADAGEPTLEGWAIVDNTTDEDWRDVQMALVSGKPISFVSELYAPRYVRRETAELPEEAAVRPELHDSALLYQPNAGLASAEVIDGQAINGALTFSGRNSMRVGGGSGGGSFKASPPPSVAAQQVSASSIAQAANGAEIADLFEYRIAHPVTIKRNESAMLPFIQDKIKARKVVLYTGENAMHPLNAAELINSTGKTLDGGPITVFDAGAYAGEALVETVKSGDKRLVSYGVDLGTRVSNKLDSFEQRVSEIHMHRGVLMTRISTVRKTSYAINNVDAKAKTLILEHQLTPTFKILNQTPIEVTGKVSRFEVKLQASVSQVFPVIEEQVLNNEIAVSNQNIDSILEYERNKVLTDAGRRAIEQLGALKRQIADNDEQSKHVKDRIDTIAVDEERIRKNLESLNRVSGQQELVQKYAGQLASVETEMAGLRDRQGALAKKNTELSGAVDDQIERMDF